MMTLYRTGEYIAPRYATSDELRRIDVGVATVDMEVDAPDDVIGVTAEQSGVAVELVDADTLVKLSDASLDRLASERAARTPSLVAAVESLPCKPSCTAPCVIEPCPVPMEARSCYDPSPCARCSRSLDRVGVVCPTPCDHEICPPAAVTDQRASQVDETCQTEPTGWSSPDRSRGTSRATSRESSWTEDTAQEDEPEPRKRLFSKKDSRKSKRRSSSKADDDEEESRRSSGGRTSSLATGTETTDTDFDQYNTTDDADDTRGKQVC